MASEILSANMNATTSSSSVRLRGRQVGFCIDVITSGGNVGDGVLTLEGSNDDSNWFNVDQIVDAAAATSKTMGTDEVYGIIFTNWTPEYVRVTFTAGTDTTGTVTANIRVKRMD